MFSPITFLDLPDFNGMKQSSNIQITCSNCKKEFYVKKYRKNTVLACSRSCLWYLTKPKREPKRLLSICGKKSHNNDTKPINCLNCKNTFLVSPSRISFKKFCSKKCYSKYASIDGNNTKYKRITVNGQRILEHRHIMQMHLGRKLDFKEHIHHINHNKLDNRIENLQLISIREHAKLHKRGPFQ